MENVMFVSCIRFTLQLLISEAVFVLDWKRRKRFPLRFLLAFSGFSLLVRGTYLLFHQVSGENPLIYTLYYVILLILTLGLMVILFEVNLWDILFAGICGYAVQHISFGLATIIKEVTGLQMGTVADTILFRFLPYLLTATLVYLFLIRPSRDKRELRKRC